jgi:hypothetical protein
LHCTEERRFSQTDEPFVSHASPRGTILQLRIERMRSEIEKSKGIKNKSGRQSSLNFSKTVSTFNPIVISRKENN